MPEGKTLSFEPGEYPQLDGLKPGATVSFEGKAQIGDGELQILSMDFNPDENAADRMLNKMSGKTQDMAGSAPSEVTDKVKGF